GAVIALEKIFEGAGKARITARNASGLVDRGDRHGRVLEETHEAHFGGTLRIAAIILCPIENQGARSTKRTISAEGDLVEKAYRYRLSAPGLEIEIKNLGFYLPGRRTNCCQQRGAFARNDIAELQRAGADLGEIVIKPRRERGIEIDNVPSRIDRKKTGGRVIEVVNR